MAKQPTPRPMPTTVTAGPTPPTPITAFTNEANERVPRLSPMSINPGKPSK